MKKKILIIDESEAFAGLAKELCDNNNLEAFWAINGLDGNNKIRSILPNLIIIEKDLTRMDCLKILQNKKSNPNTADIPVILISRENPNKDFLIKSVALGVKKFLKKPLGMDSLLLGISEVLGINAHLDNSPCVLEVRLNGNLIFVEVAMGLNSNRLEVVKYKIVELIKLNKVKSPKVLVMLTDIPFHMPDRMKLISLLHYCIEGANVSDEYLRVLTPSGEIKSFLNNHLEFYDIVVESSLDAVMEGFVNKSRDDLLFTEGKKHEGESINASYRTENQIRLEKPNVANIVDQNQEFHIAIVDDDKVVHAIVKSVFKQLPWVLSYYSSGEDFLSQGDMKEIDLVFLDLSMPGMTGFDVLNKINKENYKKIVVLTSSTEKNDVMKVLSYGIKNYIVKPINGEVLKGKAFEVLKKQKKE